METTWLFKKKKSRLWKYEKGMTCQQKHYPNADSNSSLERSSTGNPAERGL